MNNDNSKAPITFDEIAIALAKDYDSIYVIDPKDDSYVEYVASADFKELSVRSAGDNFYEDTVCNCRKMVYPEDQDIFLASFKKENVTNSLKNGKSFSLNPSTTISRRSKVMTTGSLSV